MKSRASAIVLFAALAAGGVRAQPPGGLIGQPLAAAKSNELFTFFNLAQTASQPCGGGQALGYRPTGDRFHRLASSVSPPPPAVMSPP